MESPEPTKPTPLQPARVGATRWAPPIAISSWSLHERISRGELNIVDFPGFVKQRFKIDAVEVLKNHLNAEDDRAFLELADSVNRERMRVVCLALDNDFTLPEPLLGRECQRLEDLLRRASVLGMKIIRVNPGMQGKGDDDEIAARVSAGMRHLIPTARSLGLTLALENQQLFGMKPANMINVMRQLDRSRTEGICLDFGNFFPEDCETGPDQLAVYARHVHAKSYKFSPMGNGRLPSIMSTDFAN